ncbi:MAG: polysaccharide biosynthesis C-terminal domain-containing protein [Gallionellaceae bacterium]
MQSNDGKIVSTHKVVRETSFLSKIIRFSIPSWVGFLVNIGSTIVVTRYFLPDAFGLISTFNAAATLVMSLVCLGLDSGFIRYYHDVPRGFDRNRLFLFSILIPLLILIIVSALTLAASSTQLSTLILGVNNSFAMGLLLVNVAELIIIRFYTIYYRMAGNSFMYGVLTISMQLALKGALVFAAIIEPDYGFAILSTVVATTFIVIVFSMFYGKKLLPSRIKYTASEVASLKPYILYSIYTWPIPIALYSNTLATQIIIRTKLGPEAVGIFSSVNIFIGIIAVIQGGFFTFWSGFMFENYQKESARIIKMHDYISFGIISIMCLFVLFRDPIFHLIGPNYHASKPFFALLLLSPLLLMLSETTAYGISIAKKSYLTFGITFLSVALNLGISWLTIPFFGLTGACIGSAVSSVVLFLLQSHFGQKYYRSIDKKAKTIFAVSSLVLIALVNLFLTDLLMLKVIFSISIFVAAIFVYRNQLTDLNTIVNSTYFKRNPAQN